MDEPGGPRFRKTSVQSLEILVSRRPESGSERVYIRDPWRVSRSGWATAARSDRWTWRPCGPGSPRGSIDGDSPVMRPGSRKWVPLSTISELKGALGVSQAEGQGQGRAGAEGRRARGGRGVRRRAHRRSTGLRVRVVARPAAARRRRPRLPGVSPERGALGLRRSALARARARGARARPRARAPAGTLARKLVRIVLILAAFALFPLAGILIAQGERGAAPAGARLRVADRVGPRRAAAAAARLGGPADRRAAGAGRRLRRLQLRPRAGLGGRAADPRLVDGRAPLHGRRARPHARRARGLGAAEARQPAGEGAEGRARHARAPAARRRRLPGHRAAPARRRDGRPVPRPAAAVAARASRPATRRASA